MSLLKYILKKMLMLLPVLVGISIIAFALGIMSPGDPVDQVLNPNGNESYTQEEYDVMAAKMGLDQPAVVQYFNWVDGLAHGDLGRSFFTNKSVMDQLAKRIPISLKLAGFSMILTIVFGVGFGVLMAVGKDRLPDHVLGTFSTVALSVPGFWIAIVLIFIFAEQWKILPSSGIGSYAIAGVQSKDYYVVQAYVLFSGCIYVLTNILIDLIYIALDPKIRAGEAVES